MQCDSWGQAPYGTRWIGHNKGDTSKPEYHSRLVVQETRRTSTTPQDNHECNTTFESGQAFLQLLPCRCLGWCCNAWMSREHTFTAKCSEITCTTKLRRNLVWTRHSACHSIDAGMGHVTQDNLLQGAYSPCVYRHQSRRLWYCVYSDDYVGLGAEVDIEW